jgi:hypothetical protein
MILEFLKKIITAQNKAEEGGKSFVSRDSLDENIITKPSQQRDVS